jgi:hypothetical protein
MYLVTDYSTLNEPFSQAVGKSMYLIMSDHPAYIVLMALIFHTNHLGLCWPGLARLAQLTHYSKETVEKAIERLERAGFLRVHRTVLVSGRETRDYQVSPSAMHIAPQHQEAAMRLWEQGSVMPIATKESQPVTVLERG